MEKIKIITDSTCDLPESVIKEHDIEVLSLMVRIGGKEYFDRTELDGDGLFEKMEETGEFPQTSQITPQRFYEKFKEYIEQGYKIFCITLSSKMSGTYQSANIAKNMMEGHENDIAVVDSYNVTTGLGLLVIRSAQLRDKGYTLDEIKNSIIETVPKVKSTLLFNSLESLVKGGRLSKVAGALGGLLNVKPIVCVEDGEMKVREKIRGSKKALKSVVKYIEERDVDMETPPILLKSGAEELKNAIKVEYCKIYDDYIESSVGCIVGSHAGPDAAGIFFIEK